MTTTATASAVAAGPVAPPSLPGVRHLDFDAGEVRLHVAETGPADGRPLLLVHGWPQHWWCWRRVIPLLPGFRLLMPDLRGHGWSDAPEGGYEKERLAGDLLALLDRLEIERVGWVGHDWGAYTGFLAALRSPGRLSGLLALSLPHLWPSLHDRLNPWRTTAFAYQLPLSAPLIGERLMRGGLTRRILEGGAPTGTFDDHDLELYDARFRQPERARATVALYRTFLIRELPAIFAGRYADAQLRVTTRLVVGDDDLIVRGADLRGYEGHAPDMTVERVAGAGHFLPEEEPQLVAEHAKALFG